MSFLDDVLTSIGGRQGQPPAPKPRSQLQAGVSNSKRKAEDLLKDAGVKRERVGSSADSATKAQPSSSNDPLPYRGTARAQGPVPPPKPTAVPKNPIPAPKPISTTTNSPSLAKAPSTPNLPSASSAAPKKGFAAIMARAQAAAQAAAVAPTGAIKHKPVEKLSRKERLKKEQEEKELAKLKAKAGASKSKPGPNSTAKNSSSSSKPGEKQGDKPKREPVDLGYKGTARAVPDIGYKGTANTSKSAGKPKPYGASAVRSTFDRSRSSSVNTGRGGPKRGRAPGYGSYSEDEEEDDGDLAEDYYSDESSDMEAGFDDVETEERMALRAAIEADREEEEREKQHKTEKERRKAALMRLAREREKKGRY